MQKRRIEVEPWSTEWAARYAEARVALERVWPEARAWHHIGSTAVQGLSAKPTIDILVVLPRGIDIEARYPRIAELSYDCRGECLDAPQPGTPGRFYFVLRDGSVHRVHVHVVHEGHFEIELLLGVRDYLRGNADARARYGALKTSLARANRYDNFGYMRGKDAAVRELVEAARDWQRTLNAAIAGEEAS